MSVGDYSEEERTITTSGIDRKSIYDAFVEGFHIVWPKSITKLPSRPWERNLFVWTGTQLSRWVKDLTSLSGESILYRNEDIWFQVALPKEFSWWEVSEYYKLYSGSNRIFFTLPRIHNFQSYSYDELVYGSYGVGISPWYKELVTIFYFTFDAYEALKNNGWWGYWWVKELLEKTLWNNDQYYFIIGDSMVGDDERREDFLNITRTDLIEYMKNSFSTFNISKERWKISE